ncbi:MAG TPA: hypothetical protein VEU33_33870, partial [Archangium sp.]|nr:hypothetical protein [Archangium sp.]
MAKKNAVEKRLDLLHDQWTEFAQLPEARLLRWVVEPDEVRMVEAFLEKEGDERIGECPDLFLLFDEPFEEPAKYGAALREALLAMVEESRAGLEPEAGLPPGETCPPARAGADVESFLEACGWLHGHSEHLCEHLAVVLMPSQVGEAQAWLTWLRTAVEKAESPHVRLVVLDDARTLTLEPLAEALPEKVVTIPAKLNMPGALEELSRDAGNLDSPGGRFRDLLVHMSNAATKGAVSKVEKLGAQAVAVA